MKELFQRGSGSAGRRISGAQRGAGSATLVFLLVATLKCQIYSTFQPQKVKEVNG